jgi:hypothetical protein
VPVSAFNGVKDFNFTVSPPTEADAVTGVGLRLNDLVIDSTTSALSTVT